MITSRPTALISDEMVQVLEKIAIGKETFQNLTGVEYPWEIDRKTFSIIRERLIHIEMELRYRHSNHNLLCMATGESVYWLEEHNLDVLQEQMVQTIQNLNENGPMPVWKCTTAETLINHLRNIKRLILAVAHDSILLDQLKNHLGERHKVISREFELAERTILDLLSSLHDNGSKIGHALNQDIILLERCRITQKMIEEGEATERDLGYTQMQIEEAIEKLTERCRRALPTAPLLMRSLNQFCRDALRKGESSQLTRASRWEILLSLVEDIPEESKAFLQLMSLERNGMSRFVASRERELGISEDGQNALGKAQEASHSNEKRKQESQSLLPPPVGATTDPPRRVRRMAIRERHALA